MCTVHNVRRMVLVISVILRGIIVNVLMIMGGQDLLIQILYLENIYNVEVVQIITVM